MCIADLTGSISTELGNFNSVQLSQSVFQASLGPYNWQLGTIEKTTQISDAINTDHLQLAPDNTGINVGMNWHAPNGVPNSGIVTSVNPDNIEIDVFPNISLAEGEDITFTNPITSCSILTLTESVQTKDRDNSCVDFLFLFIGSGSNSIGSPNTHIFTDDGFDFAVDEGQGILVWQGGATNQNAFIPASQLSIGTPLVSWANDIYQYVQITSISFDDNDSTAVNWTTTGTNSYQLQNGVVLKGFVDDFCTCSPSASIKDFPCESTTSYCVEDEVFHIMLSGSDSGDWEGHAFSQNSTLLTSNGGTTLKSWSIRAVTPNTDPFTVLDSPSGQVNLTQSFADFTVAHNTFPIIAGSSIYEKELTASISNLNAPVKFDVCYTESRILGPVTTTPPVPYQFDQGEVEIDNLSSGSTVTSDDGSFSGSLSDLQNLFIRWFTPDLDPPEFKLVTQHQEFSSTFGFKQVFNFFIQRTGSHADLPGVAEGYVSKSYTHFNGADYHFHLYASDSADDGNLSPSHPSYSNAGYSLAWKINSLWTASAGYYGYPFFATYYRNQIFSPYNFGSLGYMDTAATNINGRGSGNGIHAWPSVSYAYRPTNIRSRSADFVHPCPVESDFESEYHGDKLFFISPQTGSRCESHNDASFRNLSWTNTSSLSGFYEWFGSADAVGGWDGAACPIPSEVSSFGLIASDQCCIQLILNRKPTESFAGPVCQSNFGTRINLNQDLPFRHADNVIFTIASGATGNFGEFQNGRPTILDIDTQSFAKGKITLCYTASANNPFCTDTASGIPNASPPFTPDCCETKSGCVDIFFHPGFTAGKDGIHCYPTISLAGTPPIFNFTDTDISQPTWSLHSMALQDDDYTIEIVTPDTIATDDGRKFIPFDAGPSLTPFGGITNFTNSYVTEIHLEMEGGDPNANERHHGWFTMSCQVSNGPCTFTDFTTHYAAKTKADAGADRFKCAGSLVDTGAPLTAEGLIQLQATGEEGFWTYIVPSIEFDPDYANLVVDPTSPTSAYRQAVCAPTPATLQWTHISSSTIIINNEEYSITCEASDSVDIEIKKKRKASKILGHLNTDADTAAAELPLRPPSVYTGSFSQSGFTTAFTGPHAGGFFTAGWPHKMTTEDTLKDLHIFGDGKFGFKINYTLDGNVTRDDLYFLTQTNLSAFPFHIYGGATGQNGQNEGRMFRFKNNIDGFVNSTTQASSESFGLLTQSKEYLPIGPNNPSLGFHTSSIIVFSGSNSASYAAPSAIIRGDNISTALGRETTIFPMGSTERADASYYQVALTASYDDCNCEPAGDQGRLFFHLHATDFRFVTQSTSIIHEHPTSPTTPIVTGTFFINEPTLGVDVPVYRDVFALNFVSESVVVSSTGSSVIYHHETTLNTCAPFLTSSVGHNHHGQNNQGKGAMTAATNKSSSLHPVGESWNGAPYWKVHESELRSRAFPITIDRIDSTTGNIISTTYVGDTEFADLTTAPSVLVRNAAIFESTAGSEPSMKSKELLEIFYQNGSSGMSNMGFGTLFNWKAREIAIYQTNSNTPLVRGVDVPDILVTGSFLDTMTSESFIEAPTFLPAQRAYSQSALGNPYRGYSASFISGTLIDSNGNTVNRGLESGLDGAHVPYYSRGIPGITRVEMQKVVSQSVIFECTASVHDHNGRLIKEYTAEQPVMFIMTEGRG